MYRHTDPRLAAAQRRAGARRAPIRPSGPDAPNGAALDPGAHCPAAVSVLIAVAVLERELPALLDATRRDHQARQDVATILSRLYVLAEHLTTGALPPLPPPR
jgi:hypothetical protein